jgi:hypothetical protein
MARNIIDGTQCKESNMNELTMTLDVLLQDLKVSEGELRSAAFHKPNHPFSQRLESINSTLLYLKDLTSGLLEQLEHDGERVYCIETSTEVTSWVRVHAKNEKDAIRFACNVMEDRIHNRMTEEFDIELDTKGESVVDYGHGKDKRVLNVPYPETKQNA